MRGEELDNTQTYSEYGEEQLREAVASVAVEYDDAEISVSSHADVYEETEYEAYISTKVVTVLDGDELDVIKYRYYDGYTQAETAALLRVSQATVSRREEDALKKLKKHL
jgi:RNA polymerase sigma factor (sigma-70 family)